MQRLQALRSAESQWDSAERERRERAALLAAAQQRLGEAAARRLQLEEQRTAMIGGAALHLEQLLAAEASSAALSEQLELHSSALEAALKNHEVHRLSLALARELEDGKPCPVCGSGHHPAPAASLPAQGEQEVQEGELQAVRMLSRRALEIQHSLRSLRDQDHAWLEQIYGAGAIALQNIPAAAASSQLKNSSLVTEALDESTLTELASAISGLKERSADLRRAASEYQRSIQEAEQSFLKESASAEAELAWEAGIAAKAKELSDQLSSLRQNWTAQFPQLAPEEAEKAYREMLQKDEQAEEIRGRLEISVKFLDDKNQALQKLGEETAALDIELAQWNAQLEGKEELLREKEQRLSQYTGGQEAGPLLAECERNLQRLITAVDDSSRQQRAAAERAQHDMREAAIARQAAESAREHYEASARHWEERLTASAFQSAAEVEGAYLSLEERTTAESRVKIHRELEAEVNVQLRNIEEKLDGATLTEEEWIQSEAALRQCREEDELSLQNRARGERDLEDIRNRHIRWKVLEKQRVEHGLTRDRLSKLQSCLRGNAFVEYIAEEQLMQVCQAASQRLRFLSKQRYALEVDSGGGFVIRDDGNGGVRRPVSTLSGGETFLTSLSLALALSAQIQLRGQYPLQFFFLDEGFGTLDPELLDTVITSLEKLHNDQLSVGIISHVPELRARLPRKLVVVPAEQGGGGSRIILEKM